MAVGRLLAFLLIALAPADARRADLGVLRDAFVKSSRSFSAAAREHALADNGHDAWHPGDGAWLPERRAPLRLVWFPDALVVVRASEAHRGLLGARVTAIDGHGIDVLYERLRSLAGGAENYRRWNLSFFLEHAELLHALGLAASPDRVSFSLVLRDQTATTRTIEMIPQGAAPGVSRPLYLEDPDRQFRFVTLPEIDAAYLQFRSHRGTDDEPIGDFLRSARERLAASAPGHLIVDLRFDTGGNIDPTVAFFRELAGLVPGRICVIVSRMTFSAGKAA